jgi:hypothetical protein
LLSFRRFAKLEPDEWGRIFSLFMGKCGDGIAGNEWKTPALSAKFHRLHVPAFDALVFLMLN